MFHKPSTVQQNGKLPDQSYSSTFFLHFYHRTKLLIFNITQITFRSKRVDDIIPIAAYREIIYRGFYHHYLY